MLVTCALPGGSCSSTGRYNVHPRFGPQLTSRDCGRPGARVRRRRAAGRSGPNRRSRWRPTCGSCWRPSRTRTCAGCCRDLRPRLADLGGLPGGPGRQALPPGLPPRPARALPDGRPGGQRDLGHVSRDRPRRRGHRRAAARHRQARRLREPGRGDLDVGRGPAVRRDPARLLPRPPRDRATSTASRPSSPRRCCTSSSATMARLSTAARWSRARGRRRSCT